MKRLLLPVVLMLAAAPPRLAARAEQIPAPQAAPAPPIAERLEPATEGAIDRESQSDGVVRIGQDYTLSMGRVVGQVLVVGGGATIEGRVNRDVVVILGPVRLSSTAAINGSLIVVGGGVEVAPGASVRHDLVAIGGRFDAPPEFAPGGQHVVLGPAVFRGRFEPLFAWITRGLLWGRPIVPGLPWVWGIVALGFVLSLAVNLLFPRSVRACMETLARRPLTTFMAGFLVLLLTGPVCMLLAMSLIGLPVVPLLLCSLFIAWLVGKVGVARWIGMGAAHQESPESTLQSIRSFVIGFAALCLAYMVPLLGFVAWTMVGVLGLGACMLTVISAFRSEHPAPAPAIPRNAAFRAAPPDHDAPPRSVDAPAIAIPGPASSPGPGERADLASFPHAVFRDRLAAAALDLILVVIAANILDLSRRGSAISFLLLSYHIGFWTWKGTTVGGIICQLRVVRVDGAPLHFIDALVRGLSAIFSLAVLGLGWLWIINDPERQAWHDRIAGTYVVRVPRNWPI